MHAKSQIEQELQVANENVAELQLVQQKDILNRKEISLLSQTVNSLNATNNELQHNLEQVQQSNVLLQQEVMKHMLLLLNVFFSYQH